MRSTGPDRQMAEDRRDVAIAEEQGCRDEEGHRKARCGRERARAEHLHEREHGAGDERPAERMMEERRAREEPMLLLVNEEGRSRHEQTERRTEIGRASCRERVKSAVVGGSVKTKR